MDRRPLVWVHAERARMQSRLASGDRARRRHDHGVAVHRGVRGRRQRAVSVARLSRAWRLAGILMPTLRELSGQFLRWFQVTSTERDEKGMYVFRDSAGEIELWSPEPTGDRFDPVATLAEAHGIRFLCPKSFAKNGGPVGTHSVYIWFEGSPVPPHIGTNTAGQAVRWKAA